MTLAPISKGEGDARTSSLATDLPPNERLWKRYSPHHELPMSGMSSLMVHLFFLGLLVLGALLFARMTSGGGTGPAVGVVAISGHGEAAPGSKNTGSPTGDEKILPGPVAELDRVREANHEAMLEVPKLRTPSILPPGAGDQIQSPDDNPILRHLSEDTAKKIREAISKQTKKGADSENSHDRPGQPGPGGPGGRIDNERVKRQLRWTMTFNTRDGNDYLHQLKALKAILAYEDSNGKYVVIRDLSKLPAKGQIEAINQIDRLYWIDDRPESVKSLARALGIPTPRMIIAFFPTELEREMLQKELTFAGRKEEEIRETKFKVAQTPNGYEPKVVVQTPAQ
jgi:hypothetical protein